MKKLKTQVEIDDFRKSKSLFVSSVDLGEPLPKNIISRIHNSPDLMSAFADMKVSEFNALVSRLDNRIDSVLSLICEFENVRVKGWDYSSSNYDGSSNYDVDVRVFDDMIHIYCDHTGYIYNDLLNDKGIPISYLWMNCSEIVLDLVSRICVYNEKDNSRREKASLKRKESTFKEMNLINSIRDKLSDEEYNFFLKKAKVTKKKRKSLGI